MLPSSIACEWCVDGRGGFRGDGGGGGEGQIHRRKPRAPAQGRRRRRDGEARRRYQGEGAPRPRSPESRSAFEPPTPPRSARPTRDPGPKATPLPARLLPAAILGKASSESQFSPRRNAQHKNVKGKKHISGTEPYRGGDQVVHKLHIHSLLIDVKCAEIFKSRGLMVILTCVDLTVGTWKC